MQALVGIEPLFQGLAPIQAQVLAMREQCKEPALDVHLLLTAETILLLASHLIKRLEQTTLDIELFIDDPGLRCVLQDGVAKGFPHVHDRLFDTGTLFLAQRLEKQVDVSLFPTSTTDPDRTLKIQVTDYNPVFISLAHGDHRNTDGPGCW